MTIRLRPYQVDAADAVDADLAAGVQRPAVVIPTGGGKTVVFSETIRRQQAIRPGKALILVHRDELATQAVSKYQSVNPGAVVGVVKASRNEVDAPVVVGSVQTLAREGRRAKLTGVGLIIVDECHHATAKSYQDILGHYGVPAVGFTATLARGDGARLGDVWEKISYQRPLLRMIREGHLVDVRGIQVVVPDLDLTGVKKSGGDYREGDLGDRLQDSMAPETVAKAYREHAADMPGIVFAPTVATAHLFTEALVAEGFTAATVWGAMPLDERRRVLDDFEHGRIQILSNCMVLTEGFDSPRAQCAVIARPTQSSPLYIQMVGRVLRLFPGKGPALVLDVVGAAGRHELATLADLGGDRPIKPKDGQTLLKALDDLEAEEESEGGDDGQGYVGEIEARTVDLFAGSRQNWLQTEAGNWFIPAGDRLIVLIEKTSGYDVAWVYSKRKGGEMVARDVTDLGYAMAQGESVITLEEEVMSANDRAWRKRKATEKQLNYAKILGLPVAELTGQRAGVVGDAISIRLASRRLDRSLANRK